MKFEVWETEKGQFAVALPVGEDNKVTLDRYAQFPHYIRDWVLDHSFEAASVDDANRYMVKWVETQVPERELTMGLLEWPA